MLRATLFAAILLSACAATPDAARGATDTQTVWTGEEDAILETVDRFMLAVGNHDDVAMEELLIYEGVAWFQQIEPGEEGRVRPFLNADMMETEADADPFIERYWDPVILVRGGVATVWAPYELRDDGAVVHCGIDALNLVNVDGAWRIATVLSTMEPAACDELRPPDAEMRPQDGWVETPLQ